MLHIFIDLDKAVIHVIILVSFLWLWFSFSLPSMNKDKRLMEASWWERLTVGETGSCSNGWGHALTEFSVDGWGCVPFLLFGLRPNCRPTPPQQTPGHSQASLAQSLVGTLLLSPGSWLACTRFCLCPPRACFSSLWKFCNQIPLPSKVKFPEGSQSLCRISRLGNLFRVLELS